MITDALCEQVRTYWETAGVPCEKRALDGGFATTDLGVVWTKVGMPMQEWWMFHFTVPPEAKLNQELMQFATVGDNWSLHYRWGDGSCVFIDEKDMERYCNRSVEDFVRMLVEFDRGCKIMMRDCDDDSGEAYERGDVIVADMEASMKAIDPKAFEEESFFWRALLFATVG